jgi:hypothetical protein
VRFDEDYLTDDVWDDWRLGMRWCAVERGQILTEKGNISGGRDCLDLAK